jgi:CheY-like chemotaxis protein
MATTLAIVCLSWEGSPVKVLFDDAHGEAPNGSAAADERLLVLLVEDYHAVRGLMQRFLEGEGFEVIGAGNSLEALEVLAERHVDLLFSDVVLPGMNGRQLADVVREQRPNVKVLFTTGYLDGDERLSHYGVDEERCTLLRKPFSRRMLAAKVREAMAP